MNGEYFIRNKSLLAKDDEIQMMSDGMAYLYTRKNITNNYLFYMILLLPYIKPSYNYVEIDGKTPTLDVLSTFFSVSKRRAKEILKKFIDEDILGFVKNKKKGFLMYVNPYLFSRGKIIKKEALDLFKNSEYYFIYMEAFENSFESSMATELKKYCHYHHNSISEYKIFKNPETGYYLPFDIYIETGLFIEIHGPQHYIHTKYFQKTIEDFEYRQHLDLIKKEFAESNGYYLEIDLRKIKKLDDAINIIEDFVSNHRNQII